MSSMENLMNPKAVAAFVEDNSMEYEVVAPGVQRKIMSYDDSLMLVKVQFEKGSVGTLHHHYHTQISYVVKGKFEVEIDGVKRVLSEGDVFYVAPNLVHGAVCLEPGMLIDMFSPKREDFIK
jgi:quercetin dioxygenase-like cupin family protein